MRVGCGIWGLGAAYGGEGSGSTPRVMGKNGNASTFCNSWENFPVMENSGNPGCFAQERPGES